MATSLGGWFDKVFFDAHGEPCAGGSLRFFQTWTDIPQGVATFDGTPLGAVVRLDDDGRPESDFRFYTDKIYRVVVVDADGVVVKQIDGVAIPESDGGAMYNPMTTTGDLIVGGTDGEAERLAPGNDGEVLKVVSGVPSWAPDAEGMQNPMTDPGDLIVGGTGGDPARLGVGNDGDILATANGSPTWEAGPKKYRNVFRDIPSPQIDDGYLGCLFYLSTAGQTLTLPATATIPSKSFIDFVCLNDAATLTITPDGTTTLNEQATAVTIGGKSATLYRLTFLGRGDIGGVPTDQWAVGGSVLPDGKVIAATGDATRGTLNAKINPESPLTKEVETDIHGVKTLKLALGLGNDEDVLTTEEDGLGNKYALWKPPSGKLKVTSEDTLADYLGAKLVPGSNITITPQTDGDGVQTLEISATGGGGGGGSEDVLDWSLGSSAMCYNYSQPAQNNTYFQAFLTARKGTPKGIFIAGMNGFSWANTTVRVGLYNYDFNAAGTQLCYGQLSSTANPSGDVLFVPFASTQEIALGKRLWLAFCLTARGNIRIPYVQVNENSFNRFKTTAMTSGDTLAVASSSGTIQGYECGVYY